MSTTTGKRARLAIGFGALFAAAAFPFIFASCAPGNDITASESDVVVTLYDNAFDFNSIKNYFMPDTIVHLSGDSQDDDDPNLDRSNDSFILSEIESQLSALNYVRQPTTSGADFIVSLGATSTDFYSIYSYWPCYYCGGCCWYPYYPSTGVSYAYSTGTLIVLMSDVAFDGNDGSAVHWSSAINGVLNDSASSVRLRLDSTIDQIFEQSPYLGTDQ